VPSALLTGNGQERHTRTSDDPWFAVGRRRRPQSNRV
jgi:hypothetical protein